jgi:hypothetical protein
MEISGEGYQVTYDPEAAMVAFRGRLRLLGSKGYEPIVQLLDEVAITQSEVVTLDLRDLEFLNSCGLDVFFAFVKRMREESSRLAIWLSAQMSWQKRLLSTMRRLAPEIQVRLD